MPEIKYKINKYDSSLKLFCKEFVRKNKERYKITIISLIWVLCFIDAHLTSLEGI